MNEYSEPMSGSGLSGGPGEGVGLSSMQSADKWIDFCLKGMRNRKGE